MFDNHSNLIIQNLLLNKRATWFDILMHSRKKKMPGCFNSNLILLKTVGFVHIWPKHWLKQPRTKPRV